MRDNEWVWHLVDYATEAITYEIELFHKDEVDQTPFDKEIDGEMHYVRWIPAGPL